VRKLLGSILHLIPGGEYLEIENLLECRQRNYYQNIQRHCERVKERCRKNAIIIAHLRILTLERQQLQVFCMQARADKKVRELLESVAEVL
jgi:hypothetical protein